MDPHSCPSFNSSVASFKTFEVSVEDLFINQMQAEVTECMQQTMKSINQGKECITSAAQSINQCQTRTLRFGKKLKIFRFFL
jgi:hypothetical protein